MAAFEPSAELTDRPDFRLLRNTFVTMFHDVHILEQALAWLTQRRYDLVDLDTAACTDTATLLDAIAAGLDFPEHFGRNLDALNDCLSDVAAGDYGSAPNATGLVLVLRRYDVFASIDPRTAHAVLDTFAGQARTAALFGRRMMCLVQTADARLAFASVGANPVMWNDAEWPDSARGVRP